MRISIFARAGVLLPAFALAACGGGDGGSSVASTPAPASPTYTRFTDLSGPQTMTAAGLLYNVRLVNGAVTLTVNASDPAIATAKYNASTGAVSLTGQQGSASSFTADNIVIQTTAVVRYQKGVGSIATAPTIPSEALNITTPSVGGVELSYTRVGVWSIWSPSLGAYQTSTGVFGVNTLASDMPRTGSATYTTAVAGGGVVNGASAQNLQVDTSASTANFTANFAANSLTTSINLVGKVQTGASPSGPLFDGPTIALASVSGTGTISSTGSTFGGTLSSASLNGQFAGAFFGPKAAEMGYIYGISGQFANGLNGFAVGAVTGRKP